jgi:hypothetical protein
VGGILTVRYAEALDFLLGFFNIDIAGDDGRRLGGFSAERGEVRESREPTGVPRKFDPTERWNPAPRWEPRPLKGSEKATEHEERKLPDKPRDSGSWFGDE